MRVGAIDIGTNSTRLMIGQLHENGKLDSLRREAIVTRLGEGVNETSYLSESAVQRTLKIIEEYKEIFEQNRVDQVVIAATSAVRDAKNGQDFLDQVELLMKTKAHVLSGNEEAKLSFLGATYDICRDTSRSRAILVREVLVLDVGGGSTELIAGAPPRISKMVSLDIGSVRLTEMFFKNDPPSDSQVEDARKYIREALAPVVSEIKTSSFWPGGSDVALIGVAGTITTISAVKQRMEVYDPKRIHFSRLSSADISETLAIFLSKPLGERREIKGLEPKRADVIIAGALIAALVLEAFDLREIIVSEHDILDGLVLSLSQLNITLR